MSEWHHSAEVVNGKACLQHAGNKQDLQIFGRYGVLMQTGPDLFRALVDNPSAYSKIVGLLGLPVYQAAKGEELTVSFGLEHFDSIYKILKVPRYLKAQLEFAKRFDAPNKTRDGV